MKVLFLNRVYPPHEGATGWLLQELAEGLASSGANVTIVTSAHDSAHDAGAGHSRVSLERVPVLPFTRASHWKRALSYISLYPALLRRALRLPKHDIVVTMTDPPLHLLLGPVIAKFKRCESVHWAQDVYPELAEELGVIRSRSIAGRVLRAFSTWALKRHDKVIAVGRCMKERLIARGVAAEKIIVIPNWAQSVAAATSPISSGQKSDQFTIMYSGNFGLAHDFDSIVEAVGQIEQRAPSARFVFVGGGAKLPWLKDQLKGRKNVEFLPFQAKEKLEATLASADLHLVSMREDLCGLVVPSKIYGVLAAGRPSIFIGPAESEAARLLREFEAGTVVSPRDPGALITAITTYATRPALCAKHGAHALQAAQATAFPTALGAFQYAFSELVPAGSNCATTPVIAERAVKE